MAGSDVADLWQAWLTGGGSGLDSLNWLREQINNGEFAKVVQLFRERESVTPVVPVAETAAVGTETDGNLVVKFCSVFWKNWGALLEPSKAVSIENMAAALKKSGLSLVRSGEDVPKAKISRRKLIEITKSFHDRMSTDNWNDEVSGAVKAKLVSHAAKVLGEIGVEADNTTCEEVLSVMQHRPNVRMTISEVSELVGESMSDDEVADALDALAELGVVKLSLRSGLDSHWWAEAAAPTQAVEEEDEPDDDEDEEDEDEEYDDYDDDEEDEDEDEDDE